MVFDQHVERVSPQLRQNSRRMTQAHNALVLRHQAFQEIIHRQIAGGAGQHFLSTADGLANQLHNGGCFAGPRRTVDDPHILGCQGEANRFNLRRIERWIERRRFHRSKERRRRFAEQDLPQLGEAVAACGASAIQSGLKAKTGDFIGG